MPLSLRPDSYNISGRAENGAITWQHPLRMRYGGDQATKAGDIRDCTIVVQ
jgi:hypothetical protein